MNPLMNLYMRQMAARGGRMAFQGGGMDAGAGSADQGAGAGVSAGVAAGLGRGISPGGQDASSVNFGQENVGPDPDTDPNKGDKKSFLDVTKDVSEFAFNPVLGLVSLATGVPVGLGLGIANALGMNVDMGPAPDVAPDRGGRADERMIAQIPQQTVPVQLFGGDTVKLQRYEDFMKAGYPPDMAEYLVNQLV